MLALVGSTAATSATPLRCPLPAGEGPVEEFDATIVGTAGDDVIRGTEGQDVIVGLGGNDRIWGLGGDSGGLELVDVIDGGDGGDFILGDTGNSPGSARAAG